LPGIFRGDLECADRRAGQQPWIQVPLTALFRVLSPKRWELIERAQKLGPCSVRGLARELGRDVKRVHEDVVKLMEYGLMERREDGKYLVPYDVIHADFDFRAVA